MNNQLDYQAIMAVCTEKKKRMMMTRIKEVSVKRESRDGIKPNAPVLQSYLLEVQPTNYIYIYIDIYIYICIYLYM